MRTTIDIDTPILADLKRLQKREGKSLGRIASELLAEALARRTSAPKKTPHFEWNTTAGRLMVDLADKDAVYQIVDADLAAKLDR